MARCVCVGVEATKTQRARGQAGRSLRRARAVPCLPRASLLVIATRGLCLWYDPRTRVSSSPRATGRGRTGGSTRRIDPLIAPAAGRGETEMRGAAREDARPRARGRRCLLYIPGGLAHPPRRAPFVFPRSTNGPSQVGLRFVSSRVDDDPCGSAGSASLHLVDFVAGSLHGASASRSRERS